VKYHATVGFAWTLLAVSAFAAEEGTCKAPELPGDMDVSRVSDFFHRLEYIGPVLQDDGYHFWGAAPICGPDGKVHLFASRWPVDKSKKGNDFWALVTRCELAHYIAGRPDGPFVFVDVALKGTGGVNWDSNLAHNPGIKKAGDQYVLTYTAARQELRYQIGMAVSDNLCGPWKRIGKGGLVLGLKG